MYYQWAPYVPVAERRRQAAAEMAKQKKKGQPVAPVVIEGRAIVTTAWGKAWCDNLERYSDYANRLPRGRTYVRNGSVVDLQITGGTITARVSGSSLYRTTVTVKPLAKAPWKAMCDDCAGGIDSLVELLQGKFSTGVMQRLCRQGDGLFPGPKEIAFTCSCPDGAWMCKHVAAVLYGIGNRFDRQPELLFLLRQVDAADLLAQAGTGLATTTSSARTLAEDDLGALFGLELEQAPARSTAATPPAKQRSRAATKPAPGGAAKPKPTAITGNDPLSRVHRLLNERGSLTNPEVRSALGVDAITARALLQRLVADGHARITGARKGTAYHAINR